MSATTIEWATDALNPGVYGCAHASPGCTNCYAERMAARLERGKRASWESNPFVWAVAFSVVPVADRSQG